MEGAPPVANQIDVFMHFLGASRDGLVARRVDLDTISSSVISMGDEAIIPPFYLITWAYGAGALRVWVA
jgi:hypothetical protein